MTQQIIDDSRDGKIYVLTGCYGDRSGFNYAIEDDMDGKIKPLSYIIKNDIKINNKLEERMKI